LCGRVASLFTPSDPNGGVCLGKTAKGLTIFSVKENEKLGFFSSLTYKLTDRVGQRKILQVLKEGKG
jgi:hypothetical protein